MPPAMLGNIYPDQSLYLHVQKIVKIKKNIVNIRVVLKLITLGGADVHYTGYSLGRHQKKLDYSVFGGRRKDMGDI